jgi:hypothetical protein
MEHKDFNNKKVNKFLIKIIYLLILLIFFILIYNNYNL